MEDDIRSKPPSERAAIQDKAAKEAQRRIDARNKLLFQDFARTFGSGHGKRVLQWLRHRCGHNKIILSADSRDGKVDPLMTTFAAMELNLYLAIRNHLPTDILKEIENDGSIEPSGTLHDDHHPGPGGSSDAAVSRRSSKSRKRSA